MEKELLNVRRYFGFCLFAWPSVVAPVLMGFPQIAPAQCFGPVGYANVLMTTGYTLANNPLNLDGVNSISNVLNTPCAGCTNPGVADGTKVYVWDVTNQVFFPPATFSLSTGTWDRDYQLPPGRGFVVSNPGAPWVNTFVGNALVCGCTNHNFIAGSNRFSLVGSIIPITGPLTNSSFQFQATDGDQLSLYATTNQIFSDAFCYFNGYGWFDPNGSANGPVVGLGQSFFIQHPGPNYDWAQFFGCQEAANAAATSSSPSVRGIGIKGDKVTLQIAQNGMHYDVQFSPDGTTWTTIAAEREGPIWSAARPPTSSGYFRVISSRSTKGSL